MAEKMDYDAALGDPAAHFADPAAVLAAAGLTVEQKIALLRQWEYDESEISVATEEGMPGPGSALLQEIGRALAVLDPDGAGPAPSKQGVPPSP
jgi:hypothetical protein